MLENDGLNVTFVNARFSTPIDKERISNIMANHDMIVTVEEGVKSGGFGEHVAAFLAEKGYKGKVVTISLPDIFLEHGSPDILRKKYGLDAISLYKRIHDEYIQIDR
jgi:1-deoxy-D-xylulose-5-phosphate synthase